MSEIKNPRRREHIESFEANTKRCADLVNVYWERKGLFVNARAFYVEGQNVKSGYWTIVSNTRDGRPV